MDRKKAWRYMGIFLAVMFFCTFASQAADSLTVAQVQVKSPATQAITHKVTGNGTIHGEQERAVFVEEGQKIFKSYIKVGSHIKKGDILFTVDMEFLQEQISSAEKEEKSQALANADAADQERQKEWQNAAAIQRAGEDYQKAQEKGEAAVQAAREERDLAAWKLEEYISIRQDFVNENATGEEDITEQMQEELRLKERALEMAEQERNELLREAQRALEDAQMAKVKDHTGEIGELELQEKEKKLQNLQKLYKARGNIYAPADGVATEVPLRAGQISGEGAALLLAQGGEPCRFSASISPKEEKYVTKGSQISLKGTKELEALKDLSVESIQTTIDENGKPVKELTVILPKGVGEIGQTAEYIISKEAGNATLCVPLSALHQENQQYFVYMIEEEKRFLGQEWVARSVQVNVEDQNESFAALSGNSLSNKAKVIVRADRAIENGSRVRLMEE